MANVFQKWFQIVNPLQYKKVYGKDKKTLGTADISKVFSWE